MPFRSRLFLKATKQFQSHRLLPLPKKNRHYKVNKCY